MENRKEVALVLGAGAPHTPLMAGALTALYEKGKTFDHIWTAGGGALIGLVYRCPKNATPPEALYNLLDMSVADPIFRFFPVDYKVFKKPSPFLHTFQHWTKLMQLPGRTDRPQDRYRRLYNDWVDLWMTVIMPTDLNYYSKGLCAPLPFLEELIDFERLRETEGEFFLNAYNITDHYMQEFRKDVIDPRHFRAALAYPFMYPPVEVDGKFYSEGAAQDPLNLDRLYALAIDKDNEFNPEIIVLIDIFASLEDALLRIPRNLWDAYGLSIITPVVSLAKLRLKLFELQHGSDPSIELRRLTFDIPKEHWPYIMDWSYSNMRELWEDGKRAGEKFYDDHGHILATV
jgi:NTE family protein